MATRKKFCSEKEILDILNDIPDDQSEVSGFSEDSEDDFQPEQMQPSEEDSSSEESDGVQGKSELHFFSNTGIPPVLVRWPLEKYR